MLTRSMQAIMNSYNKLNGTFAAENGDLLLGVLKEEVRDTLVELPTFGNGIDHPCASSSSTSTGEPTRRLNAEIPPRKSSSSLLTRTE
jgi:hypothetical protein